MFNKNSSSELILAIKVYVVQHQNGQFCFILKSRSNFSEIAAMTNELKDLTLMRFIASVVFFSILIRLTTMSFMYLSVKVPSKIGFSGELWFMLRKRPFFDIIIIH